MSFRELTIASVFLTLGVLLGYQFAPRSLQPLTPPFAFSNGTETIEASGAWHVSGSNIPNATRIFCWFPANSCQLTVAELVPEGDRQRFQVVETIFDITQLSDTSLTATASSTDTCQHETVRIDRAAQTVTLSVSRPSDEVACLSVEAFTATLGN
jgi:hypothetical protein